MSVAGRRSEKKTQTGESPVARDRDRKRRILLEASKLFCERGFHGVGIDEIGLAAGITGPAVYRHFSGKDELLALLFIEAAELLWRVPDEVSENSKPSDVLAAFASSHVERVLAHPELAVLWHQEWPNLPREARASLRRMQGRYMARWAKAVLAVRDDLQEAEARGLVAAALGALDGVARYGGRLPATKARAMVLSVLEAVLAVRTL